MKFHVLAEAELLRSRCVWRLHLDDLRIHLRTDRAGLHLQVLTPTQPI